MKRYLWNVLIALDHLANTIAGGDPDETISSRIGRGIVGLGGNWLAKLTWPKWISKHFTDSVGS